MTVVHKTMWAGYRSLVFHQELHDVYRWDLAWNVDNHIKAADRPNVPRLVPLIRLNENGHPITTVDSKTGREQYRVLAVIYVKNGTHREMVTAIYDPTYKDPKYRYRLLMDPVNEEGILTGGTGQNYARENLEDLLHAFSTWAPSPIGMSDMHNPARYMTAKRHRPGRVKPDLPEAYVRAGFGNWA